MHQVELKEGWRSPWSASAAARQGRPTIRSACGATWSTVGAASARCRPSAGTRPRISTLAVTRRQVGDPLWRVRRRHRQLRCGLLRDPAVRGRTHGYPAANAAGSVLGSPRGCRPSAVATSGRRGRHRSPLRPHLLDVAVAPAEPGLQPHAMADDARWDAVPVVEGLRLLHAITSSRDQLDSAESPAASPPGDVPSPWRPVAVRRGDKRRLVPDGCNSRAEGDVETRLRG